MYPTVADAPDGVIADTALKDQSPAVLTSVPEFTSTTQTRPSESVARESAMTTSPSWTVGA